MAKSKADFIKEAQELGIAVDEAETLAVIKEKIAEYKAENGGADNDQKKFGKLRNRICINGKWVDAGVEVEITPDIEEYIDKNSIKEAK